MSLAQTLFPATRWVNPETALKLTLKAMESGLGPPPARSLPEHQFGMFNRALPNRYGIPAGFAKYPTPALLKALFHWGLGFVEVGSVTPHPRGGNASPRHWRYGTRGAVNFYGLNGPGVTRVAAMLAQFRQQTGNLHCVGASLANPPSTGDPDPPVENFTSMASTLAPLVDFMVVNRGCPNTGEAVNNTLEAMKRELGATLAGAGNIPVYIKFGPFMTDHDMALLHQLAIIAVQMGAGGFIATNTLTFAQAAQAGLLSGNGLPLAMWPGKPDSKGRPEPVGGYSGPLLLPIAQRMVTVLRNAAPQASIIGVGGVQSAADALILRRAGANAVQAFTGFAVKGPVLLTQLLVS